MKKIFSWLVMSLLCTAALALPRPAQIEDALASQHYVEARGMVAEVLREKPESARAHLLNAYLLAHVDHDRRAAGIELQTAAGLDKRGDVKSSPLFGRVVAEIDALPTARTPASSARAAAAPALHPADDGVDWSLGVITLAVGAVVAFLIFRRRPSPAAIAYTPPTASTPRETYPAPTYPGPSSARVRPAPTPEPCYPSSAQAASPSALGTAAAVAGGVVAGSAMSAMLMGGSARVRWDDDEAARRRRRAREDEDEQRRQPGSLTSSYSDPSPVSTSSERSSFSSSSSGSDSWSSNSSDSGSSSDWGSSGNYDSGSSSSSDW